MKRITPVLNCGTLQVFRERIMLWTKVVGLVLLSSPLFANNITISQPVLTGQNPSNKTVNIQFDISWENSFRLNSGPANWDAAWVFIKYRVKSVSGGDGLWRHIKLIATGHTAPAGSVLKAVPEGALIYRSSPGSGTFTVNQIKIQWNYGTHLERENDLIEDDDGIDIRVFAIEMVYVPGGVSFNVGGGGGENAFVSTTINTANAAAIGSGYPTGGVNNNPLFPNGYNGFYCMKYEISQRQFVEYLNSGGSLSITPNAPTGSPVLYFERWTPMPFNSISRNGLQVTGNQPSDPKGRIGCNVDDDQFFDEQEDGQSIACNFLHHVDWLQYLFWSGLRPMTELEYEKACRGSLSPVVNEFAWGTSSFLNADSITNAGQSGEIPTTKNSNVCCDLKTLERGPIRVGSFATPFSSRQLSGATYYGIMDMTGNLGEPTVEAGPNPKFTGIHGDGTSSIFGNDQILWPVSATNGPSMGIIYRGGAWTGRLAGISTRGQPLNVVSTGRFESNGGRGVRTAPD